MLLNANWSFPLCCYFVLAAVVEAELPRRVAKIPMLVITGFLGAGKVYTPFFLVVTPYIS